ncbi:MAG: phosphotransferase [Bacteroidales bacterium]|nr:phosphotransferase [Bacteroidales bacterium]
MNITELTPVFKDLYKQITNSQAFAVSRLPISGSNRLYFRIEGEKGSLIGTYNDDKPENYAFLYLASHLKSHGANVPEIYYKDSDKGVYVQQDLGDKSLFEYVNDPAVGPGEILSMYKKVIDQMPVLQYKSAANLDFSICYPRESFGRQSMQWDLNYFKYFFLKTTYVPFHEQLLEDEFQKLIEFLLQAPSNFFLFRDFQSRNIMWHKNQPYFIDFQGGRRGALQYDLASLLFESRTNLNNQFRQQILDYYLEVFSHYAFFKPGEFLTYYPAFVLIRLLQAFGAYGYRGIFEKKAFFVQSINPAIDSLIWAAGQETIMSNFPYLCRLIESIEKIRHKFEQPDINNDLTVSITSFSYRNGIPDDWSGNGGGYVFDCRVLHNPGIYEEYKLSTGKDKEVADFIEKEAETADFINHIESIIGATVKKYQQRGFSHLSVSFGCTGGRHRSVFCAETIYRYLKTNFEVNLRLYHRELNLRERYDKTHVPKA